MLAENKIIQSLWIGQRLSKMEKTSILSFIAQGHEFHLYAYGNIAGVPEGCIVKNANTILLESEKTKYASLANFSDVFRYEMILKTGNPWWVDLDVIALKPFDFPDPFVFASEIFNNEILVNGCVMKATKEFCRDALIRCSKMNPKALKGRFLNGVLALGPELLTDMTKELNLRNYVHHKETFAPVACQRIPEVLIDPYPNVDLIKTVGFHLFHSQWVRSKPFGGWFPITDDTYPETSIIEQLKSHYPSPPSDTLIAVVTCRKNKLRQKAQEDTWVLPARIAGYDVEFFDGDRLKVPDDYISLPYKAKAIFEYAYKKGYKHVLKIDDDTYISIDKLTIPNTDYAGFLISPNDCGNQKYNFPAFPAGTFPHSYITGGAVWLSRKAIEILVNTPLNGDFADDRWVGHVLAEAGIKAEVLPDFKFHYQAINKDTSVIINVPTPDTMYKLQQGGQQVIPLVQTSSTPTNSHKPNWQNTFLEKKVQTLSSRFRYATATKPKSDHYKSLCNIYPDHLEEEVDTPQGRRLIFIVDKDSDKPEIKRPSFRKKERRSR